MGADSAKVAGVGEANSREAVVGAGEGAIVSVGEANFPEPEGAYGVRTAKVDVAGEVNLGDPESADVIGGANSVEAVVGSGEYESRQPQGVEGTGATIFDESKGSVIDAANSAEAVAGTVEYNARKPQTDGARAAFLGEAVVSVCGDNSPELHSKTSNSQSLISVCQDHFRNHYLPSLLICS